MAEGGSKEGRPETPELDRKDQSSSEGEEDEEDIDSMEKLRQFFSKTLGLGVRSETDEKEEKLKNELKFKEIVKDLQNGKYNNIIVMCGAGVSTSAGIPDFRSPGSGLYDNLQKYNLPDPQCIFDISFFREDPRPFYSLAKEFFPGILKPTPSHYFMRLLHEKSHLLRVYTQNIDTLERLAGIPEEKIVEAHGTFHTSHCIKCRKEYGLEWMKEKIMAEEVPKCPDCDSYIKPDIVFFGEGLPRRFFELSEKDFKVCDLLIVMGTSLVVQPFASLIDKVPKTTTRLLINKEKAGQIDPMLRFLGAGSGLDFGSRDAVWLGFCDEGCQHIADSLEWGNDLRKLVKEEHRKIDEQHEVAGIKEKL